MSETHIAFVAYLAAVNAELMRLYGISSDDAGPEIIEAAHRASLTPVECAREIGAKYELVELQGGL